MRLSLAEMQAPVLGIHVRSSTAGRRGRSTKAVPGT